MGNFLVVLIVVKFLSPPLVAIVGNWVEVSFSSNFNLLLVSDSFSLRLINDQ